MKPHLLATFTNTTTLPAYLESFTSSPAMDFIVKFKAAGVFWAAGLVGAFLAGASCAVVFEVNARKLNAMAMTEAKRRVGLRFIFDRWVK